MDEVGDGEVEDYDGMIDDGFIIDGELEFGDDVFLIFIDEFFDDFDDMNMDDGE